MTIAPVMTTIVVTVLAAVAAIFPFDPGQGSATFALCLRALTATVGPAQVPLALTMGALDRALILAISRPVAAILSDGDRRHRGGGRHQTGDGDLENAH